LLTYFGLIAHEILFKPQIYDYLSSAAICAWTEGYFALLLPSRDLLSSHRQLRWTHTQVLLQAGRDVETIGCSSLSAAVPTDEYLFGFLLLTCTLVFQSASVPGLDQQ
jgi:hypothetical protein